MKKLVALYKTYRGGEWFTASLESIRLHCDGVVAVTTSKPWKGLPGTEQRQVADLPENCREHLHQFEARYPDYPVTELHLKHRVNSDDQYRTGLALIKAIYGPDCGVLVIDTDEVWESDDLAKLKQAMSDDTTGLYFRSAIRTYIRSPFYRVVPMEKSRVVVGLASPDVALGDSRFSTLARIVSRDKIRDVQCVYHHMGYVRLDPEEFVQKLSNTSSQDAVGIRPNWKQEVWDKLPLGKDIHPAVGYAPCWGGVEEVALSQIPKELKDCTEFWAMAGHQAGGVQHCALTDPDHEWRKLAEHDSQGLMTTVPTEFALSLCAALQGKVDQERCIFLTPRLRMSFRETAQLAYHASQVPRNGRVLEIGSGMGGSIAVMGRFVKPGTLLTAVDPYTPYDEDDNKQVEVGTAADFHYTIDRCNVQALLMRETSAEAIKNWHHSTPTLDLILVDGNHSYEHALFDLTNWWSRLKPGGTILLHDLSGRFPGVVRAAKEFEEITGLRFNLPYRSSLAWMQKP
jgi:predicted O-methyltransferase YrrM